MSERRVTFELFRGAFASWGQLCEQAASFATALPPGNLISISQSSGSQLDGLVVVWYWTDQPPAAPVTSTRSLDY